MRLPILEKTSAWGATNRYGVRYMPTWPHVSLGISAHLWPPKFAHLSLHLPVGVVIVGFVGAPAPTPGTGRPNPPQTITKSR